MLSITWAWDEQLSGTYTAVGSGESIQALWGVLVGENSEKLSFATLSSVADGFVIRRYIKGEEKWNKKEKS